MIKLYKFPSSFGLPDPSPFCMKTEILLKMAGLAYEPVIADPRKGPKGKLPAIEDDGTLIGDSEFIRRHLERKYGADFDDGLSPQERAVAHAFARMLEERTYWIVVYSRWMEEQNWSQIRNAFFGRVPMPARALVSSLIHKKVRRDLHGHGIGRHSREEIYELGIADLRALAAQLGEKPFLMGSHPTSVDATAYAFVATILVPPFESPIKEELGRHANLAAYESHMRARFYA